MRTDALPESGKSVSESQWAWVKAWTEYMERLGWRQERLRCYERRGVRWTPGWKHMKERGLERTLISVEHVECVFKNLFYLFQRQTYSKQEKQRKRDLPWLVHSLKKPKAWPAPRGQLPECVEFEAGDTSKWRLVVNEQVSTFIWRWRKTSNIKITNFKTAIQWRWLKG